MIKNYLEPKEFRIDISELYRCVKSNRENIDSKLILEFRNRAEDFMIYNEDIRPEVPFGKTNWEYIKGKYQYFIEETIEGDFVNVDYFFNQRPTPQELFEPSEWEAFEKCNPLLQEESSRKPVKKKRKMKIGLVTADVSSKIKPRFYSDNWWDYSYDLYSYFQPVQVPVDFSNSDFQYFFAWYWTLLDPLQINSPFTELLLEELSLSEKQLINYFEILENKFPELFKFGLNKMKKELIEEILDPKLDMNFEEEGKPKRGRPVRKEYKISKPISRNTLDGITSLNTEATALLFNYLRLQKVIISNEKDLSQVDLSMIIAALVGYTPTNIYSHLISIEKNKIELTNIRNELLSIVESIDKDLGK